MDISHPAHQSSESYLIQLILPDYDSGRVDYLRGGDILALGNMEELTLFCIEQYI